tara:strand:+ start:1022 stop:1810 length:789 start_codon:yes stop_codon:yes gene_type:complete
MKKIPQDIMGNITILKFPKKTLWITKKLLARKILKQNKQIKTVLEKTERLSGRFRKLSTRYLAGIKTKETSYNENKLTLKFNIEDTYFSPRLSNERNIVANEVTKIISKKKNPRILVIFAGISPYPMVIAKKLKEEKIKAEIISNELNKKANKIAEKNIKLNKLNEYITLVGGDAKNLPKKLKEKYDVILMTRPNLKDTFLKTALKLSRKGTIIFYHGFGKEKKVLEEINKETKGKITNLKIRKAGDIGPYIYRWQAKFRVK